MNTQIGWLSPQPDDTAYLLASFPSLIHVLSFSLLSYLFLSQRPLNLYFSVLFWVLVNICWELGQAIHIIPGVFDFMDIIYVLLGGILAISLGSKTISAKPGRAQYSKNRVGILPFFQPVIIGFGAWSLLACAHLSHSYYPKYLSYEELRKPLIIEAGREVRENSLVIAYYNYIFIGERYEGVHVFDNTEPALPEYIGFLPIPGNTEFVIDGDYLYANSFIDLVKIDIGDKNSLHIADRLQNVFPYDSHHMIGQKVVLYRHDENNGVVVDIIPLSSSPPDNEPETRTPGLEIGNFAIHDKSLYFLLVEAMANHPQNNQHLDKISISSFLLGSRQEIFRPEGTRISNLRSYDEHMVLDLDNGDSKYIYSAEGNADVFDLNFPVPSLKRTLQEDYLFLIKEDPDSDPISYMTEIYRYSHLQTPELLGTTSEIFNGKVKIIANLLFHCGTTGLSSYDVSSYDAIVLRQTISESECRDFWVYRDKLIINTGKAVTTFKLNDDFADISGSILLIAPEARNFKENSFY
ncbi:MAG: hypothetical protein OEZ43_11045 [Gammaproteobacteria bacterium]|nr:hypothetical protein [Gammaproteobacteria bacterium]